MLYAMLPGVSLNATNRTLGGERVTQVCRCHPVNVNGRGWRYRKQNRTRSAIWLKAGSDSDMEGEPEKEEISEDLLLKLQAAEEEAAELRKQLSDIKQNTSDGVVDQDAKSNNGLRVDGEFKRETFFSTKNDSWLGEAEVNFFARESPSELIMGNELSKEEQQVVRRRIIGGVLISGITLGLSLIPTEKLDITPTPKQPLFFYLVPILQCYEQYTGIENSITYGEWSAMQSSIGRITGNPGNLKSNMLSVAKIVQDKKRADTLREYTRDCIDYLSQVDYNQYFDTLIKPSGKQEIEFTKFSLDSLDASKQSLQKFLTLMPKEDLEAARNQLDARNKFL